MARHAYVAGVALILALWIALGLSCVTPRAGAAVAYPGQRPAAAIVQELGDEVGVPFLAARHVVGCPDGITYVQAPSLRSSDGDAWARGGDCEVWVSDALVGAILESDSFDPIARAGQAIVHEVGHALGLQHTRSGLMAGPLADGTPPMPEPYPYAWTPAPVLRWARHWFAASLRGDGWSEWDVSADVRYVDRRLKYRLEA